MNTVGEPHSLSGSSRSLESGGSIREGVDTVSLGTTCKSVSDVRRHKERPWQKQV